MILMAKIEIKKQEVKGGIYDSIIIGAGPAGLNAALYLRRYGSSCLILTNPEQPSQVDITPFVDNYIGIQGVTGAKLTKRMMEHAKKFGVEIRYEKVGGIKNDGNVFVVASEKGSYKGMTIVIATGAKHRKAETKGESEFLGKGVSYCATCVTPETLVVTNPDIKPIIDISKEKVLTHTGRFMPCIINGSRHYEGDMIKLYPRFFRNSLSLTPEHEVLVIRTKRCRLYAQTVCKETCNGMKIRKSCKKYFENYSPVWVKSSELTENDFLAYPIITELKDIGRIKISDFVDVKIDKNGYAMNEHETHSSVRVPNIIRIDNDIMRFFGYYIAEGYGNGRGISFSLNKNEKYYINDIKRIAKNVFGLDAKTEIEGSVEKVHVYSKILELLFKKLFGEYAHGKKIPQWMIFLPKDKQVELFKGMWRGDGSKKEQSLHYVTVSRQLAQQLKQILLRLGMIPNISIKTVEHQNRVPHKIGNRQIIAKHDKYEFELSGPSLRTACKLLNIEHENDKNKTRVNYHAWTDGKYAYIPIRKIEKKYYSGLVYNLAVEQDNSYTTDSACIHNCDGFFFKGKKVAVIGGGDSALTSAIFLKELGCDVTLVHRRNEFRAAEVYVDKAKKIGIKFELERTVTEIAGSKMVEKIILDNGKEIPVSGVFVAIGEVPAVEIAKKIGVKITENGFITTDKSQMTNVPGIFAAGDVCDNPLKQIITACADGAVAAFSIKKWLGARK